MRTRLIANATASAVLALSSSLALAGQTGEVWKSPTCGCCKKWVAYMQSKGYDLTVHESTPEELDKVHAQSGVAKKFQGCHAAKIGGYVIEGHVPAEDIDKLLKEKPDAIGLSVPGMPQGSPGMETDGIVDAFDVVVMKKDGSTEAAAHYGPGAKF